MCNFIQICDSINVFLIFLMLIIFVFFKESAPEAAPESPFRSAPADLQARPDPAVFLNLLKNIDKFLSALQARFAEYLY